MAPNIIPSCCLTAEQKDSLIDAVLERPVIWDCSLPDYQDVQNRRAAFAEVALLLSDGKSQYTGESQAEQMIMRKGVKVPIFQVLKCKWSGRSSAISSTEL
jgi:hypothetical protein